MPLNYRVPFLVFPWFDTREITQGRFKFLNDSADYGSQIDWQAHGKNLLWRYNLNYFHYLNTHGGVDSDTALLLMKDWIAHNPPGTFVAWDPYPISLRIVNWIKYISQTGISKEKCKPVCRSAYQQTLWLERSLERHLLGNHLFKNSKALVFAGLFFKSSVAKRWLAKGLRLLNRELDEQILSDGGHIERSLMYHSMILEDCLDLINVCQKHHCHDFKDLLKHLKYLTHKMVHFLCGMIHPDGKIALFNDAAFEIEALPSDLMAYYERLTGKKVLTPEGPMWSFPVTGYFVMSPRPGDRMLIDCGPIGPDYLPGHAHCDTLSFELSINGSRVIVDSGCYTYEDSEMRRYNRGNAGHNILSLNEENQSEMWDSYRCARRAYPLEPRIGQDFKGLFFEGGHDGYSRLPGQPIHMRRISWQESVLRIDDEILGHGSYNFDLRLHLNPMCKVTIREGEVWIKCEEQVVMTIRPLGIGDLDLEQGWYCPEFGQRFRCPVLTLKGREDAPFRTGWEINFCGDFDNSCH
ncbi:MAG: heparinase II/III family protein [Candidatus Scalinduaceae bacterium]